MWVGNHVHNAALSVETLDCEAFVFISDAKDTKAAAANKVKGKHDFAMDLSLGDAVVYVRVLSANSLAEELYTFVLRRGQRPKRNQSADV
jgi:hypothetical protein